MAAFPLLEIRGKLLISCHFKMLQELNVDDTAVKYIASKLIEICIRSSYYIFCMRMKDWTDPELMDF